MTLCPVLKIEQLTFVEVHYTHFPIPLETKNQIILTKLNTYILRKDNKHYYHIL